MVRREIKIANRNIRAERAGGNPYWPHRFRVWMGAAVYRPLPDPNDQLALAGLRGDRAIANEQVFHRRKPSLRRDPGSRGEARHLDRVAVDDVEARGTHRRGE